MTYLVSWRKTAARELSRWAASRTTAFEIITELKHLVILMTRQAKTKTPPKGSSGAASRKRKVSVQESGTFEMAYPTISEWVRSSGWIEVGQDDYSRSMVRALDAGGMAWEGKQKYATLDALWHDLESGLTEWLQKNG